MEVSSICPYCGESVDVWVDVGGSEQQRYVEDCPICCRPWEVRIWRDESGELYASLAAEDG